MRKLIHWGGDEDGVLKTQSDWAAAPEEWRAAEFDETLEYGDLCDALIKPTRQDQARELYIRRRIWWLANDRHRVYACGKRATLPPLALYANARENMLRMVELHEQAGSGIVERAELLRQMGRFDAGAQLLTAASQDKIGELGEQILGWILAKDRDLKMLGQNGY